MKRLLTAILIVLLWASLACAMTLNIKLNGIDQTSTPEQRLASLRAAALEIQQLNVAMAPLLTEGPLPSNPDATQVEGYLGDANTPPSLTGYVSVYLSKYRKLVLPPGLAPTTFSIVVGTPVDTITGEDGLPVDSYGGTFQ